ncbi:MAG: sulfotransferase [Sphingobium sp.]
MDLLCSDAIGYLDADEIVERANQKAGVPDPRPDRFRGNLDMLVNAVNDEAKLSVAGAKVCTDIHVNAYRNRIQVDYWTGQYPEMADEAIKDPIFLVGLPRSGTTYFQYLFDQDPSVRMLRTWEGKQPCPPPGLDPASVDRRREEMATAAHGLAVVPFTNEEDARKYKAMHLTDLDGPQECVGIMDQTFGNIGVLWRHEAPRFMDHLLDDIDLDECYRYHRQLLQLLQFGTAPRTWALKWPCHLLALDSLKLTYPDSRLICTHRDPVRALASNCSLGYLLRKGTSDNVDPHAVGRDIHRLTSIFIQNQLAFDDRTAGTPQALIHVDYYRLVNEPEAAMVEVFDKLDREFTPEARRGVSNWRAENPQGKRGRHEYVLEDFGLDPDEIAEEYAEYTTRFGVRSEDSPID